MPYFKTSDGVELYYRDWGQGPVIVFLSSWALGGEMWEYQMLPLSNQGYRCVALDRRGHGRSDDPGHGYDFDRLSEDVAEFLKELDLQNVTLVGHSMAGGEIARYLSHYSQARIERVLFLAPVTPFLLQTEDNPLGVPQQSVDLYLELLAKDRPYYFSNDAAIKFFDLGAQWPRPSRISSEMVEWVRARCMVSSPRAVYECYRNIAATDFRPDLAKVTIPTLVISGDRDQSTPLELCGRRTAQAISGSRLIVYEGAAHGLFITDKDRLNRDIISFIGG